MTDYAALRAALAAGPTPGPWQVAHWGEYDDGIVSETGHVIGSENANVSPENAAYIAAADPITIAALLAERDGLRDDVARLRLLLDALAKERGTDWALGYAAALEGVKPDMCPNGCGSLAWTVARYGRVTHKHGCKRRADPFCQSHP